MNPQPDSFLRGVILLTCVAALLIGAHLLISKAGAEACNATLAH